MRILNRIISFFCSFLFLKEYNFNQEKKQRIKRYFPYLLAIWVLLILNFTYGLPNILRGFSENLRLQIIFLFFLLFAIYHWFVLIYITRFAKKNIAYFILLIPMIFFFIWNFVLWNIPTYFGAMDGFANLMTAQMQLTLIVIFPTFLFALQMVKIPHYYKGWLLLLITVIAAILGIKQCIGKEGYLSDDTGIMFVALTILSISIAFYLLKFKPQITSI